MSLFKRKSKDEDRTVHVGEAIDQAIDHAGIKGDGEFTTEVVGESFYQENLLAVCGGRTPSGTGLGEVLAMLAFEPHNQHDKQAIVVKIAGLDVGYIAKEGQRDVAQLIHKVEGLEKRGAFARARFTGGWDRGVGDCGMVGVELDLGIEN
jgi:hypothetical protein